METQEIVGSKIKVKALAKLIDLYAKEQDMSVGQVFLAIAIIRQSGLDDYPEGVAMWNDIVSQVEEIGRKAVRK